MHITGAQLDETTVQVCGYDPMADSEWEFCAIFSAIQEEQKAQLIFRHRRSHLRPEKCQSLIALKESEVAAFDKELHHFYDMAMRIFKFTPFDDSLPVEQREFPF